jgi:hypothetical protein
MNGHIDRPSGAALGHPGDWRHHHVILPGSPGDFTPVREPGHHEEENSPLDALLALLGMREGPAAEAGPDIAGRNGGPDLEVGA